jgi:hypothetical protein
LWFWEYGESRYRTAGRENPTNCGWQEERKSDFDIRDYSYSYGEKFREQMCFICFWNTRVYVYIEVFRYGFVRNNGKG